MSHGKTRLLRDASRRRFPNFVRIMMLKQKILVNVSHQILSDSFRKKKKNPQQEREPILGISSVATNGERRSDRRCFVKESCNQIPVLVPKSP